MSVVDSCNVSIVDSNNVYIVDSCNVSIVDNCNVTIGYKCNVSIVDRCNVSSIWGKLKPYFRGSYEGVPEVIVFAGATGSCITGYDVTGSCITGNDVTGSREREMKGDNFPRFFPAFFPGTPLESRYEQWEGGFTLQQNAKYIF